MTTIHQDGHVHTSGHTFDEMLVQIIIHNVTSFFEIDRNQRFIKPVRFITRGIRDTPTMTGIMNKHDITGLAVLCNPVKGTHDVLTCRWMMTSIVHQNQHVLFQKPLMVNEVLLDVVGVVVTTTELPLLTCTCMCLSVYLFCVYRKRTTTMKEHRFV